MESRYGNHIRPGAKLKASPLPDDYIKMVIDVFTGHFDEGLKLLEVHLPAPRFRATGALFPNEIILAVSLGHDEQLNATTVHVSADYDPKASSPNAQDLLAACVDAAGTVFGQFLDPKQPDKIDALAHASLAAFEGVPIDWTQVEVERIRLHVKVDKANPELDQMADDWLCKNDPDYEAHAKTEAVETEKLFVTGKSKPTLH